MFVIERDNLQDIINYLQVQPYAETVIIAKALVNTPKDDNNNRILSLNLKNALVNYLARKPLGEVFDYIELLNSLKSPNTTQFSNDLPEGYDGESCISDH